MLHAEVDRDQDMDDQQWHRDDCSYLRYVLDSHGLDSPEEVQARSAHWDSCACRAVASLGQPFE